MIETPSRYIKKGFCVERKGVGTSGGIEEEMQLVLGQIGS